jgi:hypothetical protein
VGFYVQVQAVQGETLLQEGMSQAADLDIDVYC